MSTRVAKMNFMHAGGNTLISSARMLMALLLITLVLAATCRLAGAANTAVAYVTGSTDKICQLTGDYDNDINFQMPTANLTNMLYGVKGGDQGISFRHNGKIYFLFGDTFSDKQGVSNGHYDGIAWTTDTNPEDGLSLTFININSTFTPATVPGESSGVNPVEGISYNGFMYAYFTRDWDQPGSFLAKCPNDSLIFQKLYDFSPTNDKFMMIQVEAMDTANPTAYNSIRQYLPLADRGQTILFIWGSGPYRNSNPYLAYMRLADIENKSMLHYFKGIDASNKPIWSTTANESEAQPLFTNQPCIGEFSVTWNPYLKKWLMLFNCGTPRGINYRVADYPWGPWSETEVLFDPGADKDHGYCYFMHQYDYPTAGSGCDDNYDSLTGYPYRSGGEYGPWVINDFTTGITDQSTTIYFTLSTWNPYQVVLMKSTLQMVPPIDVTSPAAGDKLAVNATKAVQWTATGIAGNVKIELGRPDGSCSGYSWSTITSSTAASSESFPFTVPGPAQENCIIRVTSLSNTSIYGDSDAFNIVAANRAPIAGSVTVSPNSVYRGQKYFSFSATGFSDPDGDALTYWWGWQNPGSSTVSWWSGPSSYTNQTATSTLGVHTIHCIAQDPSGAKSAERTATLTVYNRAPTVGSITISPNPANRGQSFTVCASASDPDGDSLTYWWGWQNPGSSTVTWWQGTSCFSSTAPTTAGAYTIHCISQDSYGAQSPEKTATMMVK